MSIDPTNFKPQGKPTLDQARTVYDSLEHPTIDKLHTALTGRGYSIARATIARWISNKFLFVGSKRGGKPKGVVSGIAPAVRAALKNDEVAKAKGEAKDAAMIGSEMTPAEISAIQADLKELATLDLPQLKAMQERERVEYNIMLMRYSKRNADKLVLIPKDSAAMVIAMTHASDSLSTVAPGQLPGDGAKLIEATANPPNPVADAISLFKKRQGVAA